MIIDYQIKDEKIQYDINRETAKISALSSGTINKYEYLMEEEILPSEESRRLEQATCTSSLPGKAFEKQTKTIEEIGAWRPKSEYNQLKIIKDNYLMLISILMKINYCS